MAEQNILTGDLAVLDQIIGDLKEHRKNIEQLEKLNEIAKDLTKNIENDERELKEEIDGRIKESTASICEGYDKAIDSEKSKLKDIQSQRDKAKMAGVKERIANETKELRNQNEEFEKQIKDAFKMEKVPMYCSRRFYRIMIQTRGFADSAVYTLILLVLFLGIPALISFVPGIQMWMLIVYYFAVSMIIILPTKIVTDKTVGRHGAIINAARETKDKIIANRKKIKKIEKRIHSDRNEEMYGLEDYDFKINEIHDSMEKIEGEKACALQEFENTAKPDIIAEIESRSKGHIDEMKAELLTKQDECSKLEALVKEQRIYISSNYETYLGKEFMNTEKLEELRAIMKSQAADTIGRAMAVSKDKR